MKSICHGNVVQLYDVKRTPNNLYLIMEYCNNGNLEKYLKNYQNIYKYSISERESLKIIKEIIKGYKQLIEKKIIHRDLKLENILIHNDEIKLSDFGFSRAVEDHPDHPYYSDSINFQSIVGSPVYMSPQILAGIPYTFKTDIYSLGIILYKMLFNKFPFVGENLAEILNKAKKKSLKFPDRNNKSVEIDNNEIELHKCFCENQNLSEEVKDLIRKMLEFDEEKRLSWEEIYGHKLLNLYNEDFVISSLESLSKKYNNDDIKYCFEINKLYFMENKVISSPFECSKKIVLAFLIKEKKDVNYEQVLSKSKSNSFEFFDNKNDKIDDKYEVLINF